jgi:hypothetical protein
MTALLSTIILFVIAIASVYVLGTILAVPTNVPAGKDCNLYANTGTHGSPTWALESNVQDLKISDSPEPYQLQLRNSGGFHTNVLTMTKWSVTFKIADIYTDAFYVALVAAKNNKTALDLQILDGLAVPASGVIVQGPRADWVVTKFDRDETSTQAVMYDVELQVGQTGNNPSWVSITGS